MWPSAAAARRDDKQLEKVQLEEGGVTSDDYSTLADRVLSVRLPPVPGEEGLVLPVRGAHSDDGYL